MIYQRVLSRGDLSKRKGSKLELYNIYVIE